MRYIEWAEIILFVIIGLFSIKPVDNYDFWFHIKYGEYILTTRSLPFTDVFSHTALGQPAVPYEWMFQVLLYLLYTTLGNVGIQALVVTLAVSYTAIFRNILKKFFRVPLAPRMLLTSLVYTINYDFWVERPQSAAYLLFMITAYLILKRVVEKQNLLILMIPVMLVWTNLHASIIVGLFLLFAMACSSFFYDRKAAIDLGITGIVSFAITLLPPLGTGVWRLLLLFWQQRTFIMTSIDEWVPLPVLGSRFYLYIIILLTCYLLYGVALIRKQTTLWYLPLAVLGGFVLTGVRQTAFTMPAILLLAVPAASRVNVRGLVQSFLIFLVLLSTVVVLIFYRREVLSVNRWYPEDAVSFVKKAGISGNMFNELEIGGFLLYHLGPELKTYIDGRTDMFLPEVFPEQARFHDARYKNDTAMYVYFSSLVTKYHISWVILTKRPNTPWARLIEILRHEKEWALVFEDATAVVFVGNDGVNTIPIHSP